MKRAERLTLRALRASRREGNLESVVVLTTLLEILRANNKRAGQRTLRENQH